MQAIFCTAYGPPEVLKLREIPTPEPREGQVLVKIMASSVTMGDIELRTLTLPGWVRLPMRVFMGYRRPRNYIPGLDFSGIIEKTGPGVDRYAAGDEVFGSTGFAMSGNATHRIQPVNSTMVLKPKKISHEEATCIPVAGINALHFLRLARLNPGQKMLINGAGGSFGSFAIQIAKQHGALVTGVDSKEKLDLLLELGADKVIDYRQQDFTRSTEKYDVIMDMLTTTPFGACLRTLAPGGKYLMANPLPGKMIRGIGVNWFSGKEVISRLAAEKPADMRFLAEEIASGKLKVPIDRIYPLDKVPEAQNYVEQGHKKGHIVIRCNE